MPSQLGDLCAVVCPVLPVPDKLTKSQFVSQDLWGAFQVAGNNCDLPGDSCSDVTGEHSLGSTVKAQKLLLTLLSPCFREQLWGTGGGRE